jgi:hypothetical protein
MKLGWFAAGIAVGAAIRSVIERVYDRYIMRIWKQEVESISRRPRNRSRRSGPNDEASGPSS